MFCSKCTNQKWALNYAPNKQARVCRHCHDILTGRSSGPSALGGCNNNNSLPRVQQQLDFEKENVEPGNSRKGLLEVRAKICLILQFLAGEGVLLRGAGQRILGVQNGPWKVVGDALVLAASGLCHLLVRRSF